MKAGELRYRITIQSRSDSQDASGQPVPTWGTLATVWASFDPERGREYFAKAGELSANPARFRIRYRSDVTTKMRVSFDSRVYDIKAVVNARGDNRETHLYCDTGLTQG